MRHNNLLTYKRYPPEDHRTAGIRAGTAAPPSSLPKSHKPKPFHSATIVARDSTRPLPADGRYPNWTFVQGLYERLHENRTVPQDSFADNGLVELEALEGHGTFLAMERSFAVGVGNTIRLFETSTAGATDVSGLEVLNGAYEPMSKRLVADLETDLGIDPDNVEGMRFGPTLPDGRHLLILVSDNNFNPGQTTQIIALAVTLQPAGD